MEWICGFVAMVISSEAFDKPAKWAPVLITIMLFTTFGMASVRKRFPDEERGLRNFLMVSMGFIPPDIPIPAVLQPYWSGAPMRQLEEKTNYVQLELQNLFPIEEEPDEEDAFMKSS